MHQITETGVYNFLGQTTRPVSCLFEHMWISLFAVALNKTNTFYVLINNGRVPGMVK